MLDKSEILPKSDITTIIGSRISLKRKGKELVGLCPFHKEKNPSFTVDKRGFYKCFGCGESGDAADFVMKFDDVDFPAALKKIQAENNNTLITPTKYIEPPLDPQIIPVPVNAPAPTFVHSRYGVPTKIWNYYNDKSQIIGYVCRFEPEGEKKQILPLTFRARGGWTWKGFDNPRPLYNLHLLCANNLTTTIIVEGEKTADAVSRHINGANVTTWIGGTNAVDKTNWEPLKNTQKAILWPDNDYSHMYGEKHALKGQVKPWHEQPGNKAMLEVAEILIKMGVQVSWIQVNTEFPCGWDAADKEWTGNELRQYILANRGEIPKIIIEPEIKPETKPLPDTPFRALGFKKEGDSPRFCFFAGSSKTVITLSATAMTKQNLLNLAPLNYWENYYPAGRNARNSFNVDSASEYLINSCLNKGIFSDSKIRGRGSWIDNYRTVLHSGDRLIVDGVEISLHKIESRYVYEQGEPLDFSVSDPLDTYSSQKLIEMIKLVSWSRKINSYLLAGWCVIAPVCGALKWRPHIWITGPAGTGKSWILKEIIRTLLGESAVAVQADTTAPGLRALLGNDALPVVFDEAEGEHQAAQDRIRSAIELMRAASADDGGVIAKGSAGGGRANTTKIRSMFCFSSIVPQASMQADKRRITSLELKKDPIKDNRERSFEQLVNLHAELINDDFVRGLHARTIKLLPTIVYNSDVFNKAAAAILGEKSYGDQLGPMLAGAYSLYSEDKVTYEFAKDWIPQHDWSEESSLESNRDELRLFSHLMEQIVEVEGEAGRYKRSIGELCQISRNTSISLGLVLVNSAQADSCLRRIGIKVEFDRIVISNSHDGVKRLLFKTSWGGGNHSKLLIRIEGAEKIVSTTFSPGGVKSNAVSLPGGLLD